VSRFLKLIRIQNLLFIAVIQCIIRQFVIAPLLETSGIDVYGSWLHLSLLIAATVLIAAGGYIINDYFDVKIDILNKPDQVLVGRSIDKRTTMLMYQFCTFGGIIIGLWLSWQLSSLLLAFIFLIVPGLLWFYSASYKRQLIIGNVVIAFLSALSVLTVLFIELERLKTQTSMVLNPAIYRDLFAWVGGFALFSFLLTWIREIIKDMEDIYGDREMECRTLPIVWGIKAAKIIVVSLIGITTFILLFINFAYIDFEGTLTLRYTLFGLILPFAWVIYLIIKAKHPVDYHRISMLIKFVMVLGLLYAPVFYFLLARKTGLILFQLFTVSSI
jgi:4-hydroxybenzoate polyprenyltransferase